MCKDVRYFTFFEFFYKLALHTTTCTHTVQFRSHDSQSHQSWRHSIPTSSSQQRENIDEVLNVVIWVLSKHGLRPQSNVCGLSYTWLLMNSSRQHSVGSRPRLGVWTQPWLCMIDFSLRSSHAERRFQRSAPRSLCNELRLTHNNSLAKAHWI